MTLLKHRENLQNVAIANSVKLFQRRTLRTKKKNKQYRMCTPISLPKTNCVPNPTKYSSV